MGPESFFWGGVLVFVKWARPEPTTNLTHPHGSMARPESNLGHIGGMVVSTHHCAIPDPQIIVMKEGKREGWRGINCEGEMKIFFNPLTWQLKQVGKSNHPSWENLPRLCFCGNPRTVYQLSYNFPTCVSAKHLTKKTNSILHFKPTIINSKK